MLLSIKLLQNAALKASRNLSFIIQLMQLLAKLLTQQLYAVFNSKKQLTLSSYRQYNKYSSIQSVQMLFSIQRLLKLAVLQLLQLLKSSSLRKPTTLQSIYLIKCLSQSSLQLLLVQLQRLVRQKVLLILGKDVVLTYYN